MRRPTVRLRPVSIALVMLLGACDGQRRGSRAPYEEVLAAGWIDASTVGAATVGDPDRLDLLEQAGPRGRMLRLDRLLDLYDGARFGDDKDARDSLWLALGGYATTRGIDASREVVLRLLDQAYALEDLAAAQPGSLGEDEQKFVADAIMLLSTDMFLPDSSEALISQTLAYRVLVETGHPRIADNARWRLYDHVRGVLEGAVGLGPELRPDVLVHALYVEQEDISAWLEDVAPHAKPPLPSPAKLWELLDQQRAALAEIDRWEPVVESRRGAEAELRETVVATLPWPRDPAWVLPQLARGTGQAESLAPVVLLAGGQRILEPTSDAPIVQQADALSDEDFAALEGLVIRDGRGIALLAADPQTPAPDFSMAMSMLAAAGVSTIELAVHEPRLDDEGSVVVALPLHLRAADDVGPGAQALREARIQIQLTGRGPRFRVDGRWLSASPALPSDVRRFAADLHRAYPRERVVRLDVREDVQPGQLVDLLAVLVGGIDPLFVAAGVLGDAALESSPGQPEADQALAARLALVEAAWAITIEGGEALSQDDRARVEQASESLRQCVPELEAALPKQGVTLELRFVEGKVETLDASGRRIAAEALERFESCAKDRLLGFRLREAEAATSLTLRIR